ncbi:MAG TPA: uroporphyrinogen decarboxylase [Xanthobacteraceae bacterium]|nr:uroporphyrinogen decarboxylase [Xanthobacteraceae bacterium]
MIRTDKAFLRVLDGSVEAVPPVWLMRQAGRYLPEYLEIRRRVESVLDLCFSPKLAAEVTLQPVRRFALDVAILFSDILVVPHALGRRVCFIPGDGPRIDPIRSPDELMEMKAQADRDILDPVYDTVRLVKDALPSNVALLGFCGAPWTVATYMIAGESTPDQAPARLFAYRYPEAFAKLIDILAEISVEYLGGQLEAGVDAVQIFDTWAGVLPPMEFERWCVVPTRRIIDSLRKQYPGARIIAFPRSAGTKLEFYAQSLELNAVGLDWTVDRKFARERVQSRTAVQGNLDPLVLVAGGAALDREVDAIMSAFARGRFIFNLGHGILPNTPIEHVERMLKRIRG